MKDIGGYFEFEHYHGKEYHDNCVALNTARNCLRYLIRTKKISCIHMPKFNCSAVLDVCREENVSVIFYELTGNLQPILPPNLESNEYLYLVNYYGQLEHRIILKAQKMSKNIIIDNVQAFFEKPIKGIDTIYTCRKFFGVTDGAYLYTNKILSTRFEEDESFERLNILSGRFERSAGEFYSTYQSNEEILKSQPIKYMSKMTRNLLKSFDYDSIIARRESNFEYLHRSFENINRLPVHTPIGPYMYPLYVSNGYQIREKLKKQQIFISTLWPNVLTDWKGTKEYDFALNILPLPCDQRYGIDDMKRMVEMITKYMVHD